MPPKKSGDIKLSANANARLKDCCDAADGICQRKSDGKAFDIHGRKYSKKECLATHAPKGFTARASCAPFKDCKK